MCRHDGTILSTRLAWPRLGVLTHSDDKEMRPPRHSNLPVTEPLSILKRPTTDPSSASTDATNDFLSKSAVMLGLHRTTTGLSVGRTTDRLSDTVLTLSTHHMEPTAPTKCPRPCLGVQAVDTPTVIQDPVPKDCKKGTQGMMPYITPDGAVPSPVNQTIFWLDPSTGGWYQKHPDMGYCCVEVTTAQADQLVPHDQMPTAPVTESGLFPPVHSLSSIVQSALEPSAPNPSSPALSAPTESSLMDPTVVVVVSSAAPTVRFNPLQTPTYDSTVVEEVSVPTSTVCPELPRPPMIKELVDVATPMVATSVPKLAPLTTVMPSPQAEKPHISLYIQLPGKAGVDHFYEFATCLRCKETGSHALSCALHYEYPVALVLDSRGFCLQARFSDQAPKPSNYGLEPYTYYPIQGLVAYQFWEQPGKTHRCRYLHKIELRAPMLQCPLASSTPVYGHDIAAIYGSQREKLHPLEEASSSSPDSSWEDATKDFDNPHDADGDGMGEGTKSMAHKNRELLKADDDDPAQEQLLDGVEAEDGAIGVTHAKRKSTGSKHFHYHNPPMWTTPTNLILTRWRMRCPVCYHQDGHSATCSERHELPVILWIQPMFIHSIVHYMTYADGEWWHDRDPKPRQLWGRGHHVHRLDEGTDCLLEWGASFPKGENEEQLVSRKFEGEVPNLDLTIDSTQGRDGYIDDLYVPGDQGYHPLPRRECACQTRTQSPAQDIPEQVGPTRRQDASVRVSLAPGKVTPAMRCAVTGGDGGPEPPPKDKLCDHCLQVAPRPCPRYDEHDTHECPCDHWNSECEKEKHEQWKHQWESIFERKQQRLDEWEARLCNYFADLSEMWQRGEPPMFVPSIAEHQELMKSVIPAVKQLSPFQPPSSDQWENVEAWHRRHTMPLTESGMPGEYLPERKPTWEKPRAAYVGMPFQPTSVMEQ